MTKYYVDTNGVYLGGFCGCDPPEGAVEVPDAPMDARMTWANGGWVWLEAEYAAILRGQVKAIRATALEWFNKNAGVSEVYNQNFQAATLGAADTTTGLRNGKTPAQHLSDFGTPLGMTAAQFGAYVLSENLLAGQKMTEIEAEYLRLYYGGPLAVLDVDNYKAYCDARIT
jgi:hypothetical protein